jgi:hypothetical protein
MKYLSLILLLVLTTLSFGQTPTKSNQTSIIGESERYEFHSHFWFNMHHFFQYEALTQKVTNKSKISQKVRGNLSHLDKDKLDKVIAFYQENMIDKDLRTSDYMKDFRLWIITQNEDKFSSIPDKFKTHIEQLQSVKKIYADVFWQEHNLSNKQVLSDNLKLIKNTENYVSKKLTELTRQPWQREKIRIDIVFYAKSEPRYVDSTRPYTSIFPTHVVMDSWEKNKPIGHWLELLYHESSHHLIDSRLGFVGGTITDFLAASKQKSLQQLWHAYLFYFSGKVTQEALKSQSIENYELYMVHEKVFTVYMPYFEKHLPDYINHKRTLIDVTESIIKEFHKDRK